MVIKTGDHCSHVAKRTTLRLPALRPNARWCKTLLQTWPSHHATSDAAMQEASAKQ
eukprot:CAMPEP_0174350738 /NCGR_PEP_ID=MMETSP0811_2-20130205/7873_1 /TAXON_ID=73025 ORGANISM="Eutreptiella gymnastica-like, Strain CCMP1594" /NCGR_SAMPLE_ID=MMETSP0811_2 /ASSEMBLY_ACC=CAM_ASM_000667 /LENGTH=55 /DNA_ID=CAMNT_0015479297 /DNA_START=120 /DNA_END=287 /DNA_ORIENTATION=-